MLDDWLSEEETAAAVQKTVRTLRAWRSKRIGPPYAYFGRTVKYRKSALSEHYQAVEVDPARRRLAPNSRART